MKYILLIICIASCSQDVFPVYPEEEKVVAEGILPLYLEEKRVFKENVQEQASFVADFDSGTFMLNGKSGTKASLVDPYRIQPKGTNEGVKDNALLFPLNALGVTGDEWTYWIELTFPENVSWTDYNFFAEAGTLNRSTRIVHRITPDLRCVSEFYGGDDASYQGSERSSFSVGGGTRILIQQTIDKSSVITKLGDDPVWQKEGISFISFQYLAVGADLLGFQEFPEIKINRVLVFDKKIHDPIIENQGYDVSAFTEEVFFDDFDSLNLRAGAPNNYRFSQGVWTPRFSYTDNEVSPKGWTAEDANSYKADPTYNWPDGWSPFDIDNSTLKIRMDRTNKANLISEMPINPATGQPYEWAGGVLTTKHSNTFRAPCYVEARIKFPSGKGLWNAFWLYNNYDGHKEIDIAEQWTADLKSYGVAQHNFNGTEIIHEALLMNTGIDLTQDYHRYGVVWADGKLVFLLDGKEIYTIPEHRSLSGRALYIILNTSIGGYQGDPDGTTPDSNEMLVDWVRVKVRK
ncbi:glycoside hydrolase family 16 protein [Kriegella aquimaris]|nr:glycoside hydrolase family 16 protein [Kriegella aquimaris]